MIIRGTHAVQPGKNRPVYLSVESDEHCHRWTMDISKAKYLEEEEAHKLVKSLGEGYEAIDGMHEAAIEVVKDLDEKSLEQLTYAKTEEARAVAQVFRKAYRDAVKVLANIAIGPYNEDDWECIFDVDRPVEEWNLLGNVDLLKREEGEDVC